VPSFLNLPDEKYSGDSRSRRILASALEGKRLCMDDAVYLLQKADLLSLGRVAQGVCRQKHPGGIVTFVIDRNVNYTNVCTCQCRFCAFYRPPGHPKAYLLDLDAVARKVEEAVSQGATQIMLQGGLHPGLDLDYYQNLISFIKSKFNVTIHSFSPPEIDHIARTSGIPVEEVLRELMDAGLDSLPGGGAEILVDRVRRLISPNKISAGRWLKVMEKAHQLGLRSTATMMMGSVETIAERVQHLEAVRRLQDQTGGFRAFIAWTFQPRNTQLGGGYLPVLEYLRTLAVARLYLDNIQHLQGSWVTQGPAIGQITLAFGANDLGSIMLEENVVRAAGTSHRITVSEIVRLIRAAGRVPAQRDTSYRILRRFE